MNENKKYLEWKSTVKNEELSAELERISGD